jgi:nitroreductase
MAMTTPRFIPLPDYREYPVEEMRQRAADFYKDIQRRRTVRDFSRRSVPMDIIETCLLAAGTAPNGANLQPWHFVVVSNPDIKRQIRTAAEAEPAHRDIRASHTSARSPSTSAKDAPRRRRGENH